MERGDKKDKDSMSEINSDKNLPLNKDVFDVFNFLKKDKESIATHKKIERLISAVYLITNHLPDSEPIKWNIRDLAASLITSSLSFLNATALLERDSFRENMRDVVLKIVSLLDIAVFGNLLSPTNVSILKREFYLMVKRIYDGGNEKRTDGVMFEKDFFEPATVGEADEQALEDNRGGVEPRGELSRGISETNLKDIEKNDSQMSVKRKTLKEFSSVSVKKNQRKSVIINLLKRKREIIIKDISSLIPNCSEKTLQRELMSLVKEGVLKKEGSKRWTKYSLA
jgi:hypothetical protein